MKLKGAVVVMVACGLSMSLSGCLVALAGAGVRYQTVKAPASESYTTTRDADTAYAALVKTLSTGYSGQSSNPETRKIVGLDNEKLYRYTCSVHQSKDGVTTIVDIKVELVADFDTPEVSKLGFAHASDRLKVFSDALGSNLGETLRTI